MLNAADFHSTDRGFGMKYLMSIKRSWVLSRLAIEMTEMPRQYTRFTVETWVESAMRYFTSRNFRIIEHSPLTIDHSAVSTEAEANNVQCSMFNVQSPKVLGYGRSIWAMIDTETRQPTDIYSIDNGAINQWIEKDKPCPIDKGGRVKMGDQAELVRTIDTYYNDVDINGHINSVKYIEHVLDIWPLEWYRNHSIRRLEIAYVAEAHAGDRLSFYREEIAGNTSEPCEPGTPSEFCVRICKDDDIEVARCKVRFA
jgi:acyl-ACP thioesterase